MFGEKEIEFLNNLDINEFNKALKQNENIFDQRIERFLPFHKILSFYYDNLPKVEVENRVRIFTTKQLVDMTLAFYKQLSPETYKRAKKTMSGKERDVILHPARDYPDRDGEKGKRLGAHRNRCGFLQGKKYIEIEPENHLSGLVRAAHELGHACTQFNFDNNEWYREHLLSEIDSRFAEILMAEYLIRNGMISQGDAFDLINHFTAEQREKLGYCLCEANVMSVLKQIQEGRDVTKQDLQDVFSTMNGPIIDSLNKLTITDNKRGQRRGGDFEYELQYVIGTIVATSMFGKFLDDKKYMKWYDKNYLDTIHKLTFEEGIVYIGNKGMKIEEIRNMPKEERGELFGKTLSDMLAEHLAFAEDNNAKSKQFNAKSEREKK